MHNLSPVGRAAGQIVEFAETHRGLDLEPIARTLGGSYALLFRMRAEDNRVEDAASHGVDLGYVNRLVEAGRERMLPPWLAQLESGTVIDRAAYGSDRQFARTAFYNHVIRPEGRFHCIIATPLRSRNHSLHMVVGKPCHRPGFDADDMRLFRRMLPLVNEIIQIKAGLIDSEAAARQAFGISEAWSYPVLVADLKGVIHYANRSARQHLATGDALVVDGSTRLKSTTAANNHRMRQAFAAILRTGRQQAVTLDSATSARGLRLSFRRTDGMSSGGDRQPDWIVITAEEQGPRITGEHLTAVQRRHGLTAREAALLSCLVQGAHLKDACRQLGISYNTGRCHLRQIFGKTEVHRQSDLVRLCTAGLL